MTNSCPNIEIFVLPITFQTVTFHHRGAYNIRMTIDTESIKQLSIRTRRQLFSLDEPQYSDSNGNIYNVGGQVQADPSFLTNR